jgi:methyl-accepting chemotaxis protein
MWAQIVMAAAMLVVAAMALGAIVFGLAALRGLNRAVRLLERSAERLTPRTEPILLHAERIAADLAELSGNLRRDYGGIHETIEDASQQLREAVDTAQERVRHFGAVLQVVQQETEEVLLDAAATARGVHTAASALRGAREERRLRRLDDD